MLKKITIFFIVTLFLISPFKIFSQKYSNSNLPNRIEYTSLKEALRQPDSVYILKLKRKKLTLFPKEIFLLKNLKVLVLSVNKLSDIPEEIDSLKFLEELDISSNKFTHFPKAITRLTKLKILKIFRNEIPELPKEIGDMKHLEQLIIWDNPLTNLPDEIGKLKTQIKQLNLSLTLIRDKNVIEKIFNLLPDTKIEFPSPCDCLK